MSPASKIKTARVRTQRLMCFAWLQRAATAGLVVLAALGMGLVAAPSAEAQGYVSTVLHSFANSGGDGQNPFLEGLIKDASGNLYGTTSQGGASGLEPCSSWSIPEGHTVRRCCTALQTPAVMGTYPYGSLVIDALGNLYRHHRPRRKRLRNRVRTGQFLRDVQRNGAAQLRIIRWGSTLSRLIMDASGNLYGTTFQGGTNGVGTVFELVNSGGTYNETVLHSFASSDGAYPYASLFMDASGILYGTTLPGRGQRRGNRIRAGQFRRDV